MKHGIKRHKDQELKEVNATLDGPMVVRWEK